MTHLLAHMSGHSRAGRCSRMLQIESATPHCFDITERFFVQSQVMKGCGGPGWPQ